VTDSYELPGRLQDEAFMNYTRGAHMMGHVMTTCLVASTFNMLGPETKDCVKTTLTQLHMHILPHAHLVKSSLVVAEANCPCCSRASMLTCGHDATSNVGGGARVQTSATAGAKCRWNMIRSPWHEQPCVKQYAGQIASSSARNGEASEMSHCAPTHSGLLSRPIKQPTAPAQTDTLTLSTIYGQVTSVVDG
jgi:hypothetical protein